ncbi:molybdenum ABC transporter ATP-binding protein [Vreelandella sulfidaeris]|uniref:molybdenum ABC transporter ATP-binding protein n=1 Tax=Vreelandella sulfidaeris TaxID=115553 RepID=UPI0035ED1500
MANMTIPPMAPPLTLQVEQQLGNFQLSARLDLPASGVTGIYGHSGSGKTSLLRLIAGLERPQTGLIKLGEHVMLDTQQNLFMPSHQRRIGIVFQEARLFPHYRVRGNLRYGMPRPAPQRFADIVELLGIEVLLERMPGTLSGGEARRVAIGRALLSEPQLLLMDEPLTGLDGARKEELLRYITRLTQQVDIPVVYVSHDADEITTIANHLVVMKAGRVEASDALNPLLNRFELTRELGGFDAASLLEGKVVAHDTVYGMTHLALDDGQQLSVPGTAVPVGSRLRLRICARDIELATSPPTNTSCRNQLNATIMDTTILPDAPHTIELRLNIGELAVRARVTRQSWDELALASGMQVVVLLRALTPLMSH